MIKDFFAVRGLRKLLPDGFSWKVKEVSQGVFSLVCEVRVSEKLMLKMLDFTAGKLKSFNRRVSYKGVEYLEGFDLFEVSPFLFRRVEKEVFPLWVSKVKERTIRPLVVSFVLVKVTCINDNVNGGWLICLEGLSE